LFNSSAVLNFDMPIVVYQSGERLNLIFDGLQRLHEENEKLFDRLTQKASTAGSPKVGKFHNSLE